MPYDPRYAVPYTRIAGGHGSLTAMAFSPDPAGVLATAGQDGAVRLWEVARRARQRAVFEHGPSDAVLAMAFSADGGLLVTLASDGRARVWGARAGDCLRAWECPDDDLRGEDASLNKCALALSDDGALLATGYTYDFAVKIWGTATGRLVRTLEPDVLGLAKLAFVPRRPSMLAVLDEEQGIRIWEASAGYPTRPIGPLPGGPMTDSMRFSRDGRLVATAGHNVGIWDARTGHGLVGGETDDCGGTSAVAFSPDGSKVVTSGYSHPIGHVWDLSTLIRDNDFPRGPDDLDRMLPDSALVTTLDGVNDDVAFSPDGGLLAAIVGEDVALWHVGTDPHP
ncbi:WD40 repeat domain-containing protein [Actinomadura sp. KC345]|uniref:WD40 repeat domain-containing protein n=1 Tax=Actinomadura sp. KC345 TaxID=2530371 RepID=UPI0014048A74|nr:WD40 repeat domain-containing protein [Actinomadura sp. KC345]